MNTKTKSTFTLKGNMLPITQLHVKTNDLDALGIQLKKTVEETPQFFNNMPVIIDLNEISGDQFDFSKLTTILKSEGLIPVGVNNVSTQQEKLANAAGLGLMASSPRSTHTHTHTHTQTTNTTKETVNRPKIVSTPVRSGQQIYAQGTDLIILAPVSPGAEVIADGHIHIYGPLRGRALAGVTGDIDAHIFCHSLQAELISIAGNYKLQDNFNSPKDVPVKIFLKENNLIIEELIPKV